MNRHALLLLLLACGLALAALMTRMGELLVLTLPFLCFVLVALMESPVAPTLVASRITDKSTALAGEPIQVVVALRNMGDAVSNIRIRDSLPASARLVEGQSSSTCSLAAGDVTQLTYSFSGSRGICVWASIDIVVADPLGLLERRIRVPAPGEVIIRPAPFVLSAFPFRPRRTLHSPGPIPVPLAGIGTDFLGVREYRPGDPLRRINWRLSARHPGALFTNEHERHEAGDFGVVLDARFAQDDVFEAAVTATASLAECILRDGNRLSLLVFGRSMAAAFPGYGKRQLSLILRTLAGATRSPHVPLAYLEYFPARLFPREAVLIVVSSPRPNDADTFAKLRAAGYEVLLVSPDPLEYAARKDGTHRPGGLGLRLARIERRATLLHLSRLGVHIVDWPLSKPIGAVMDAFAPRMLHRRGPLA